MKKTFAYLPIAFSLFLIGTGEKSSSSNPVLCNDVHVFQQEKRKESSSLYAFSIDDLENNELLQKEAEKAFHQGNFVYMYGNGVSIEDYQNLISHSAPDTAKVYGYSPTSLWNSNCYIEYDGTDYYFCKYLISDVDSWEDQTEMTYPL